MGRDIVKARTTQNGATVAGHTMDIKGFDLNSFLLYFFFLASPPFLQLEIWLWKISIESHGSAEVQWYAMVCWGQIQKVIDLINICKYLVCSTFCCNDCTNMRNEDDDLTEIDVQRIQWFLWLKRNGWEPTTTLRGLPVNLIRLHSMPMYQLPC